MSNILRKKLYDTNSIDQMFNHEQAKAVKNSLPLPKILPHENSTTHFLLTFQLFRMLSQV